MSVSDEKNFLRQKYKIWRSGMSADTKRYFDKSIFENIVSITEYQICRQVLTYVSTNIEVDTLNLIEQAFRDGKNVAVPKSLDKNGNMEFYGINSFDDLEQGYFGIFEPVPDRCERISVSERAVCIIPALSYDSEGYRLGYGKGFYDRFLSEHRNILKIGICYSECMEKHLPHEEYDIPADMVITEKFVEDHRKEKR